MINSINNLVVCKPYGGSRGLRANVSSGVAVLQQKTQVIGLEVLMDAEDLGISKGDLVYVKEEILYNHKDTYSNPLKCEKVDGPFILAHYAHVVMVEKK
jgi:hypothetical protein